MTDPTNTFAGTFVAIWHAVYATMRAALAPAESRGRSLPADSGAVSIEHVLWYAAAAISVAVVAAIIWSQVRTTASTPVQSPSAP
jgi:hypothetical protein